MVSLTEANSFCILYNVNVTPYYYKIDLEALIVHLIIGLSIYYIKICVVGNFDFTVLISGLCLKPINYLEYHKYTVISWYYKRWVKYEFGSRQNFVSVIRPHIFYLLDYGFFDYKTINKQE